MIDKDKFGERRGCFACGCKFYDMNRRPPTCPKCGTDISKPPKVIEEVAYTPADIEEEDDDVPEEIDDKNLEVDTEDDLAEEGGDED